jgi:hypothetical protein
MLNVHVAKNVPDVPPQSQQRPFYRKGKYGRIIGFLLQYPMPEPTPQASSSPEDITQLSVPELRDRLRQRIEAAQNAPVSSDEKAQMQRMHEEWQRKAEAADQAEVQELGAKMDALEVAEAPQTDDTETGEADVEGGTKEVQEALEGFGVQGEAASGFVGMLQKAGDFMKSISKLIGGLVLAIPGIKPLLKGLPIIGPMIEAKEKEEADEKKEAEEKPPEPEKTPEQIAQEKVEAVREELETEEGRKRFFAVALAKAFNTANTSGKWRGSHQIDIQDSDSSLQIGQKLAHALRSNEFIEGTGLQIDGGYLEDTDTGGDFLWMGHHEIETSQGKIERYGDLIENNPEDAVQIFLEINTDQLDSTDRGAEAVSIIKRELSTQEIREKLAAGGTSIAATELVQDAQGTPPSEETAGNAA